MKYILLILLAVSTLTIGVAQDKRESQRIQDSIYQVNIKKTRINGVYIPKDLDDAFKELDELSTANSKTKYKLANEELVAKKLHFGLGSWMKVNWNFEQGSRIVKVLRDYGLTYTDDMVNFMLRSYHRHLNGVDQDIKARVKVYVDMRNIELRDRIQNGEIISTEIIPIEKE